MIIFQYVLFGGGCTEGGGGIHVHPVHPPGSETNFSLDPDPKQDPKLLFRIRNTILKAIHIHNTEYLQKHLTCHYILDLLEYLRGRRIGGLAHHFIADREKVWKVIKVTRRQVGRVSILVALKQLLGTVPTSRSTSGSLAVNE